MRRRRGLLLLREITGTFPVIALMIVMQTIQILIIVGIGRYHSSSSTTKSHHGLLLVRCSVDQGGGVGMGMDVCWRGRNRTVEALRLRTLR